MGKVKKILTLSFMAILLWSCGSNTNDGKPIDVSKAEIIGESSDFVAVSNGTALLMNADGKLSMKIGICLKKLTSGKIETKEVWTIDLLDANGITLASLECKDGDNSTLENLLNNGSIGDAKIIVFSSNSSMNDRDIDKAYKETSSVRLNAKSWKDGKAKSEDTEED